MVFVIYYENDTNLLFGRRLTLKARKKKEYSLRDIVAMDSKELAQMVFTLNDKAILGSTTRNTEANCYKISKINISSTDSLL
jgi:hypothetical protein